MFVHYNPNPPRITDRTLPFTISFLRDQLRIVREARDIAQLKAVTEADILRAAKLHIHLTQWNGVAFGERDCQLYCEGGVAALELLLLLDAVEVVEHGSSRDGRETRFGVRRSVSA